MYRALIFCIFFLSANLAHSAIYQWVDEQGNTHYGQQQPRDKSIASQKIEVRTLQPAENQQPQKSIQDSANEIAKSNAARKTANDAKQQSAEESRQLQTRCETSKKNLAELDYGGNRLYKDAEGNYSRFSAEDKSKQREQLNAFINENCR
jgi:hypothetical protein